MGDKLKNVLNRIREFNEPKQVLRDDQTPDKYLRSLRRQRMRQLEEGEKKRLKEAIRLHEKKRMREDFYGGDNKSILAEGKQYFKEMKYKKRRGKSLMSYY